ncbi:MAG TPA: ferric reductase-like transmembrane domain-containing protein [Acidobacteriaceae bacterium]|nr:ferric reductase-like transmembrane domain-containing protein [Acidobacteriaceae bacterium]
MDPVEISADAGLVAVGLATVNFCIGLLIATRYSPVKCWPHRQFNLFWLHRCTAYATIAATLVHPILLLFVSRIRFRLIDLLMPVWSPLQPLQNSLGAVALYLLLFVLLTSFYRLKIGRVLWRRSHWLVYPAALLLFIHGIFTDSELHTGHADLLDGEKVFVEICLLIILAGSVISFRLRRKRLRVSA